MKIKAPLIAAASLLALTTAMAGPNDTDQVDIYWTMGLTHQQSESAPVTLTTRAPSSQEDTFWHLGLSDRTHDNSDINSNRSLASKPRPFGVDYPHVSGG